MLVVPWAVVVFLFFNLPAGHQEQETEASTLKQSSRVAQFSKGVWGKMEIEKMVIEPSEHYFLPSPKLDKYSLWEFEDMDLRQVEDFLLEAGLADEVVRQLIGISHQSPDEKRVIVEPPIQVTKNLTPAQRSLIYNRAQYNFFRFMGDTIDQWFQDSGVSREVTDIARPYLYRRGKLLCFSDMDMVIPKIKSPIQRILFQRALCRQVTYSLRLHLTEKQDVESMISYWMGPRRNTGVETMLRAIANREGGGVLDVVYLLPVFARTRLCTYLNPTITRDGVGRDCTWTALNFFNDVPDHRLGNTEPLNVSLKRYKPVRGNMKFGDIVFFLDAGNRMVHSCIYIADDIAFSKNGASYLTPFAFERLADIESLFESMHGPLELKFFRLIEMDKPADKKPDA